MKTNTSARLLLFILISSVFYLSCNRTVQKRLEINPEFATYISAYTSGYVSSKTSVTIRLASDYTGETDLNRKTDMELFSFDPGISGETWWIDSRTIEFRPDSPLEAGKEFTATFYLGKLMEVPSEFEEFVFQFKVREQTMDVATDGLSTYDPDEMKNQKLEGILTLSDWADSALVEKCLRASQGGKDLKIQWMHDYSYNHKFIVHNIERKKNAGTLMLSWNGSAIGSSEEGEKEIAIPALGDFHISDISVVHDPEQYLVIHFTDPLMINQNFNGLVTIEDASDLNFSAEGHKLIVFPSSRLSGPKLVNVFRGVKNVLGYSCQDEEATEVNFEELKPQVRQTGEGTIIPGSEKGMLFPFEAVNLKSVDLEITRVFENNIIQFLQVNNLDGDNQLRRVGKSVLRKKIDLDPEGKLNLHEWNSFSIDLSDIIKVQQGAIYRIELNFRKAYSVYTCNGLPQEELTEFELSEETEWSEEGWGYFYDDYYYESDDDYYYYHYDYRERENPCHDSYYYNKGIAKNILISDIGLTAKAGSDKQIHVFANDIRTTRPMPGVKIEYYSFTQQLLGTGLTDGEGHILTSLEEKPFLIVASKGAQKNYLRLRDGESLSLSKFDVDGESVQKGVKGFIYTERGVWRPGDSIYVSFMLEDKENILPAVHPVNMELVNPQGNVVYRTVKTKHLNGLYDFRTSTGMDDPTGYYTVNISVGNRRFTKTLRVETVKPNRLKVYLDFGGDRLSVNGNNKVKLNSKWLHGAPAKNLDARVEVTLNSVHTSFKGYDGYTFDDPARYFSTEDQVVFDGSLDEQGNAEFQAELSAEDAAPGMLKAYFTTRVFEKGGGFSIDRNSVLYSPYESYVGIKTPKGDDYYGTLVTDQNHTIEVATVDAKGKPVSRRNLEVKVYHVRWRYWWDRYDNDLASYIGENSAVPVFDSHINTTNGKGRFTFRIDRPKWGRFLIYVKDPVSGHSTGKIVYVDWPSWARANRKDSENATMLNFSTDKEKYSVGENVKVTFPSVEGGRALISVESGIKVLKYFWVETGKGETKFEFKTSPEMAPNCYVNISLLQPHAFTANDMPLRMYGVLPVLVEDPASHLEPVISIPDVIRPETKTAVTVKESSGKPMTYTLAIVDEGLLDLTSFPTPDPWAHFNAREALGVKTWDLYDEVMGAFTAKMDKLLAIGGDGEAGGKKGARANRFKPMVYFSGPHELKAGATKTHTIEIPNYVGSARVMVVAGQDEKYGSSERTVAVRNPLMVLGTLPRVIGPGETVYLPVNVFAMEKHVKNVDVEIQVNDMFKPKGGTKKKISFSSIGDEVVNFELQVPEKLGVGKVKILARSGNETARHEIEIDIRASNPRVSDVTEAVIEPGKEWSTVAEMDGLKGTNNLTLEVSSIPPINLGERLKYLITYPHGCIEQTTSSVFPQLFLQNVMDLNMNFKAEISSNVNEAIRRIQLFTTNEGGFSYWPGDDEVSEWGTTYAGHFLLEAEKAGYRVPSEIKSNWIRYQQKMARNWRMEYRRTSYGYQYYDDLTQAYRLYTLALAKVPEMGAMNRMRESSKISLAARWRLAAAYQLANQPEVASRLIVGASTEIKPYTELSFTFGNEVRDKAMILEALSLMNQKSKAAQLMKEIAEELNSNQWMSTQTTAFCLLAVSKYVGSAGINKTMKFNYAVNSGAVNSKSTQIPLFTNSWSEKQIGKSGKIKVKNTGAGMIFVRVIKESIPVTGDQRAISNVVDVDVNYYSMNRTPLDISSIEQGTDFIAEVIISNNGTRGYLSEMALTQIFPSGWEIHNQRMDETRSTVASDYPNYQDIRDDRVYTYYDIAQGTQKVFRFKLNAAYLGKFYLPSVSTEAMYDISIQSRKPGRWVEVVSSDSETASK